MTDKSGRQLSFRDITGSDLEYLESILGGDEKSGVTGSQVIEILSSLSVTPGFKFSKLVPRTIRSLYSKLYEHILCNYMPKETWLRQCYGIQNGSFQNLADMEKVPMSKFVAMCQIHKEAMDSMKNSEPVPTEQ